MNKEENVSRLLLVYFYLYANEQQGHFQCKIKLAERIYQFVDFLQIN